MATAHRSTPFSTLSPASQTMENPMLEATLARTIPSFALFKRMPAKKAVSG